MRKTLLLVATLSVACADSGPTAPLTPSSPSLGKAKRVPAATVVTAPTTTVQIGQTTQLTATYTDTTGAKVSAVTFTWASSNPAVATVSSTGLVKGIARGSATVTATANGTSGSVALTIAAPQTWLYPGDDIQARVNALPAGTTFILKPGTYRRQSIVPKDGDSFLGEPGAVLTGEDVTDYAFKWDWSRSPKNVRIHGLTVERYNPPAKKGAILSGWDEGYPYGTTGWLVDSCEIRYNRAAGIRTGNRMRIIGNKIHHNEQIGIVGTGDSIVVEGNEIAFNNPNRKFDYWWEAGGAKFVITNGLVVRNNYVHDNVGPGLWSDIDSRFSLYEGNRVDNNVGAGIMYEISYDAVIRNNTATRNGSGQAAWLHGAGIFVQNSANVEVYGNTVADNFNGITAVHQNRGSGKYGAWVTKNVSVHDNKISMRTGMSGFAQDVGDKSLFSTATIRYDRNVYSLFTSTLPFHWNDDWNDETRWRAFGQDAASVMNR